MKSQCKVSPGTIIQGKWHKNIYTIIKELGFGANGTVYLVRNQNTHVALKMSSNGMSITSEVNVLKSFAKVQGSTLGPCLLDVDDWQNTQGRVSFYVMEYIQGPDLLTFIQQNGKPWISVLLLQLLNSLDKMHESGWVFGDLKPENLIVTGSPTKIRCIDVGGTTIQGRAIKEFTEFFDRGYWGLGTRKADPTYDLFAVGMIMINMIYPKRFNKTTGGIAQLREAIRCQKDLIYYEKILLKALQGQYKSAKEMRTDLLSLVIKKEPLDIPASGTTIGNQKTSKKNSIPSTRQSYKKKKKKSKWLETLLILTIIVLFYILYILGQLV